VLKRVFGPKREELMGCWRRLRKEKFHNFYYVSPNIIGVINSRRMKRVENVARMRYMRNAFRIFVGKPEGKSPRGRPRRRCEYNIRMDLSEIEWEDVDWIHLAQDRYQCRDTLNRVMNFRVP